MKTSRAVMFAFASVVALGSLMNSAANSPAAALDLSWTSNKQYMQCLNYASLSTKHMRPGAREVAYDNVRRQCNRSYYPGRPGYQY